MHRFLRTIGFSQITERQMIDPLLTQVMNHPDSSSKLELSPGHTYAEFRKQFSDSTGLVVCGEYDALGQFHMEHYFPYLESSFLSVSEDITVNKRIDTDAYTGMCDDMRLGISLIFYLQNAVDYLQLSCSENTPRKAKTILSGLSVNGKILLGIESTEEDLRKKTYRAHQKNQLIARAKHGDQDAIDSLTVNELDLSAQLRRRIKEEDLYSMVETSFVPYGSESDNYAILGTIVNWRLQKNTYTGEEIYLLLLSCNDVAFSIAINKSDLLGEPMINRRFKGEIWLQGYCDFQKM